MALKDFQKEEWPKKKGNVGATMSTSTSSATLENAAFKSVPVKEVDTSKVNGLSDENDATITESDCSVANGEASSDVVNGLNDDVITNNDNKIDSKLESNVDDENYSESKLSNHQISDSDGLKQNLDSNEILTNDSEDSKRSTVHQSTDVGEKSMIVENVESLASVSSNGVMLDGEVHGSIIKTMKACLAVLTHPTRAYRATELSLEGIAMLVQHQYYAGKAGGIDDLSGSGRLTAARAEKEGTTVPPPSLLHRVLEGIANISETSNETVQAAIINTLTTIVTSPKCNVHEGSLLLAMRSTFHVYLVTKSQTSKTNAKAALVHMLRSVFMRMEAHDVVLRSGDTVSTGDIPRSRSSSETKIFGKSHESANNLVDHPNSTPGEITTRTRTTTDGSDTAVGSALNPKAPISTFPSQYHADAYFLFRALGKLSSKELPADNADESERKTGIFATLNPTDPTELNSKILSLELILAAIEVCGEAFTCGEKFLFLVQQYISGSLLKNCISNHTDVAFLSQRIFLVMVSSELRFSFNIFFLYSDIIIIRSGL